MENKNAQERLVIGADFIYDPYEYWHIICSKKEEFTLFFLQSWNKRAKKKKGKCRYVIKKRLPTGMQKVDQLMIAMFKNSLFGNQKYSPLFLNS